MTGFFNQVVQLMLKFYLAYNVIVPTTTYCVLILK